MTGTHYWGLRFDGGSFFAFKHKDVFQTTFEVACPLEKKPDGELARRFLREFDRRMSGFLRSRSPLDE